MHAYLCSCPPPSCVCRGWFSGWQQIPSSVLGKVSWGWFSEVPLLGVGGDPDFQNLESDSFVLTSSCPQGPGFFVSSVATNTKRGR